MKQNSLVRWYLITGSSGTVRQQKRTRTYGHLGFLLETVKNIHVHHPRLVWRRKSQHQDDTIASIWMSPDDFPLPMMIGSEGIVGVDILKIEHSHVEQKLGLMRCCMGTAVEIAVVMMTQRDILTCSHFLFQFLAKIFS